MFLMELIKIMDEESNTNSLAPNIAEAICEGSEGRPEEVSSEAEHVDDDFTESSMIQGAAELEVKEKSDCSVESDNKETHDVAKKKPECSVENKETHKTDQSAVQIETGSCPQREQELPVESQNSGDCPQSEYEAVESLNTKVREYNRKAKCVGERLRKRKVGNPKWVEEVHQEYIKVVRNSNSACDKNKRKKKIGKESTGIVIANGKECENMPNIKKKGVAKEKIQEQVVSKVNSKGKIPKQIKKVIVDKENNVKKVKRNVQKLEDDKAGQSRSVNDTISVILPKSVRYIEEVHQKSEKIAEKKVKEKKQIKGKSPIGKSDEKPENKTTEKENFVNNRKCEEKFEQEGEKKRKKQRKIKGKPETSEKKPDEKTTAIANAVIKESESIVINKTCGEKIVEKKKKRQKNIMCKDETLEKKPDKTTIDKAVIMETQSVGIDNKFEEKPDKVVAKKKKGQNNINCNAETLDKKPDKTTIDIDKAVITQVEVINNATLSNMNDEKEELNSNGKEFPEIPETEETKGVNPKKNHSNEQISINNTEKEVENGTNVVVDKDEIALDGEGEEIASDISKDPDEMQQNGYCEKQHEKPIKLEECADQPLSTKVESQIKIDIEECHTESRTSSPKQKVTSDNDERDEINLDGNNGGERNHKKKKVSSKLNREKEKNEKEQDDQTIEDEKKEKKVDSQIKIDIEESCGKQKKKQTKQKQQNNQPKVDRIKSGEVIAKKYLNENKKGNCTVQKDIPVMLAKEVSQRDSKKCTGKNLETLNLPITAFLNTDLEIGDFENDANKKKKSIDLRQKGSSEMIQKNNTPQTVSKANDTCKQVSKYISQGKQQTKPQKHATNHNSTERNSKIAGMMKNNHVFKCDSKVKKNDYCRAGILTKGRERRLYELEMVYKGTKRGDYKKMIMKHRKPPVKKRPPKREPKNIIIGTVDMGPGVQFYRTMEKSLLTS